MYVCKTLGAIMNFVGTRHIKIVQADSSKDSSDVLQFLAGTHCGGSRGDRPRLEPKCKQHAQGRQHHSSSARQVSWLQIESASGQMEVALC